MRLQRYLTHLWNTLTSPRYYLEILNQKMSFSWWFFLISFFLLSLLASSFFIAIDIPVWRKKITELVPQVESNYPSNLKIAWDTHQLSLQPPQPFTIAYPKTLPQGQLPDQLALLNTQVETVEQALPVNQSSPLMVVTKNKLYLSDFSGGWSSTNLNDLPWFEQAFTIDKQNLANLMSMAQKSLQQIITFVAIIYPVAFFIARVVSTLFSILFDSLLIFFLMQLFKRPLPYGKIFQISLHISVVAELIQILTQRLVNNLELNMYSTTYWIFMAIILFTLRSVRQIHLEKITKEK